MASHWGDVQDPEVVDDDPAKSILSSIQGKFRNGFSNFDLPPLHQPSSAHKGPRKELAKKTVPWLRMPVDSFGQNHLLHSIELQYYKKKMRYMFSLAASHQIDVMKSGSSEVTPLPSPPPPPKRYCSNEGLLKNSNQRSFLSKEFDATKEPVHQLNELRLMECPIELDTVSTRQLLLKSVSAVCAHTGFEFGSDIAINTLTDVFAEHFSRFCKVLKTNIENQEGGEFNNDYLYALEHTLKAFGIDCISSLQLFWNKKVKEVATKLEQESMDLLNEYNAQKETSSDKRKPIKEENNRK